MSHHHVSVVTMNGQIKPQGFLDLVGEKKIHPYEAVGSLLYRSSSNQKTDRQLDQRQVYDMNMLFTFNSICRKIEHII